MFGTNGFKVEFADFRVTVIDRPPGTQPASEEPAEEPEDDDEEPEVPETNDSPIASEEDMDPSVVCKTKPSCLERANWCTQTFAAESPPDCSENFAE